jgi:uncharacterized membrane protein
MIQYLLMLTAIIKKISHNRLNLSICFFYTLSASLVSLHRFWQYESFYYDFGIFDRALWLVSRFQIPTIDHITLGRTIIFADHFSPFIYLLAPVYWLTDKSEILFIIQAIAVSLSGFILYKISQIILKNHFLSLAIMVSYFLFVGLQNALITDFHEITVATLPLMLIFWAIAKNRIRLFWILLILTLGFKENLFATGVGIGLFIIINNFRWFNSNSKTANKAWIKTGIFTIIISIIYGYLATKIIIPYFSHGNYLYNPEFSSNPISYITGFVDDPLKRHTLWYSFLSFLFLPIFSIASWPMILQDLFIRLVPLGMTTRWTLGMQYNAQTAVLLAIGTVYGSGTVILITGNLKQFFIKLFQPHQFLGHISKSNFPGIMILSVILMINSVYLHQRVLHGPLGLSYNPDFYRHTANFKFLNDFVAVVPQKASVMTQNHLAVRFTHQELYLVNEKYPDFQPQYIILDLRPEQNPIDFFGFHGKDFWQFASLVAHDPNYSVIYNINHQLIYQHK